MTLNTHSTESPRVPAKRLVLWTLRLWSTASSDLSFLVPGRLDLACAYYEYSCSGRNSATKTCIKP